MCCIFDFVYLLQKDDGNTITRFWETTNGRTYALEHRFKSIVYHHEQGEIPDEEQINGKDAKGSKDSKSTKSDAKQLPSAEQESRQKLLAANQLQESSEKASADNRFSGLDFKHIGNGDGRGDRKSSVLDTNSDSTDDRASAGPNWHFSVTDDNESTAAAAAAEDEEDDRDSQPGAAKSANNPVIGDTIAPYAILLVQ